MKDEITPDEIFAESSNLSEFNTAQFEGRIEKPIARKTFLGIGIFLVLVFSIFSVRLWYLQIINGAGYQEISENNRLHHIPVFSERGVIFDRNGEKLAWNVPNGENPDFSLRQYKDSKGLAHVVGYVTHPAKDSSGFYYQNYFEGKTGVEKVFDDVLKGQNGIKISETNALGDILSESIIESPEDGGNIYLSIDSRLQQKLYEVIEETADEVGYRGGASAIMDTETGEIIALVSYPEYDLQTFSLGGDKEKINEYLFGENKPMLNRVTSGMYTPGSIIKPYLGLAALNEGVIDPNKKILSTGELVVPNPYNPDNPTIFTDFKAYGWVDLSDALAVSSNIYFYQIGGGYKDQPGLGIIRIEEYVRKFGFGENAGIDLGSEQSGVIPNPEWKEQNYEDGLWRLGDTYNTSIGQYGFQVTPIQALRAVSAIASDGLLFEPSLIRSDGSTVGIDRAIDIPREHFVEVKEGMRQAVLDGIITGLQVPYVNVAAKTGTAELGFSKSRINSWVTGFFPYEDPKYAFVTLMESGPRETNTGAVFVTRTVLDWMSNNTPEYFDL